MASTDTASDSNHKLSELQLKMGTEISRFFLEESNFVNQWFTALLQECQSAEARTPSVATETCLSDKAAVDSNPRRSARDFHGMWHQIHVLESAVQLHAEQFDGILSQLTSIQQSLQNLSLTLKEQRPGGDSAKGLMVSQQQILEKIDTLSHTTGVHLVSTAGHSRSHHTNSSDSENPAKTREKTSTLRYLRQGVKEANRDFLAFEAVQGWVKNVRDTLINKGEGEDPMPRAPERVPQVELKRRLAQKARSTRVLSTLDIFSNILVVLNAIFAGVQIHIGVNALRAGGRQPAWLAAMDTAIAAAFLTELMIKIGLQRWSFLTGPDKFWNCFDSVLMMSSLVTLFSSVCDISFIRSIRVLRSLRAVRLIKSLRFVRDLRLMIASIVCSASSLFWALVMLSIMLYLFALFVQQGVLHNLEQGSKSSALLLKYYGSLGATMLSLFMAITGGKDWSDLIEPLLEISYWYYGLYIFYLLFVVLGIMNILTAIFCESAGQIAQIDRDLVIQDHMTNEQSTVNELRRVFQEFDENHDGSLDEDELGLLLKDDRTKRHLSLLGIDVYEAHGLFTLLDITGTGEVSINEFVNTLLRLKGQAKALDLATLIYENKRIMGQMARFMKYVHDQFDCVKELLENNNIIVSSPSDFVASL